MNNQKQNSLIKKLKDCTKKATQIFVVVLAFVMLYEEASLTPPVILAKDAFETESENSDDVSPNLNKGGLTAGVSKALIEFMKPASNELSVRKNNVPVATSSIVNETNSDAIQEETPIFEKNEVQKKIAEEAKIAEEKKLQEIYNNISTIGYLNSDLNIRTKPSMDSEVCDVFTYGTEVTYGIYDDYWAVINYDGGHRYISRKFISDTPTILEEGYNSDRKGRVVNLPSGLGTSNSFMAWQMVTSKSSPQYKLKHNAGQNFDKYGYGMIDGRYAVATTTTYGDVGDFIDISRSDGSVLKAIIVDIKNQNDKGCNKWGHDNGNTVVEFVVDKDTWYQSKNGRLRGYGILTSTDPGNNTNSVVSIKNRGKYFK